MSFENTVGISGGFQPGTLSGGKLGQVARQTGLDLEQFDVSEALEDIPRVAVEVGKQLAKDRLGQIIGQSNADVVVETGATIVAEKIEALKMGGSGGVNIPNQPTTSANSISPSSVSYISNPIDTELSTGLAPVGYGPFYQTPTDPWDPLHVSFYKLQIPASSTTANTVGSYMASVILVEFINAIQGAVGFQVNLSVLTTTSVTSYLNAVLQALQTYYFYDSVLTYCNNAGNRNDGMYYLRETYLTASGINNLMNLKRILQGTPIPTNMLTIVKWLSQSYSNADLGGGSILKVSGVDFINVTMETNISNCLSSLRSVSDTMAQISRAAPKWVGHSIGSSNEVPLYDRQFLTLWSNLPFQSNVGGSGTYRYPSAAAGVDVKFSTHTNNIDGAIPGMISIYNTSNSTWSPAIGNVFTVVNSGVTSSRLSYTGNSAFIAPEATTSNYNLASNRGETYFCATGFNSSSATFSSGIPIGCEEVFGINTGTILQSAYRLVDYLLTLDSIGKLKDSRVYGKGGDSSGGKGKTRYYK
jgi:hypothetical protein